jgi:hypothetical protein
MRLGTLEITFHRTVRVPDGRQPSNLPPSLGRIELYPVSKYVGRCPKNWEPEGYIMALHDTQAMWMSFTPRHPVALLVGAGGTNALNGEELGTSLAKDNYVVAPPQPWLDGWKDTDGTVYQFVATPYKKGKGISVAEQLMGQESRTGAIGIALFDPKDVKALKPIVPPMEGYSGSIMDNDFQWTETAGGYANKEVLKDLFGKITMMQCSAAQDSAENQFAPPTKARALGAGLKFTEMAIGRGGKVIQKIYPDPHGLDVWQAEPSATLAIYLVNARLFAQITGQKVPEPVGHDVYQGHWFGMNDSQQADIAGTQKFSGLKSAVFPASDLDNEEEKPEQAAVVEKP